MFQIKIRLFGPPRFECGNQAIDFGTRKAVALIAYLAVTGRPHSREALTAMLWPEYGYESASQAFRQTLYISRKCLGKSILPSIGKQIVLDSARNVWIDVKEFHASVNSGLGSDLPQHEAIELLEKAVALYQGDLLAGFTLKDSLEFDEWQSLETESTRQKYGRVLETLVGYYKVQGKVDQVLDYALRSVQFDQLDEAAHRDVMLAYAQMGQRAAALRHYDAWAQILAHQLHIEPSEETRQLREMIASEELVPVQISPDQSKPITLHEPLKQTKPINADDIRKKSPGPRSEVTFSIAGTEDGSTVYGEPTQTHRFDMAAIGANIPKHNLPSLATIFVGRETELTALAKLIDDPNSRMITILGPGGIGKSRLALESAKQIVGVKRRGRPQSDFPNGVWFIEAAQIQSIEDIITTIADAVGFRFQGDRRSPRRQLLDYFRTKKTLLILDNFEHLLPDANIVDEIILSAPYVKLIITSREKLNLYGETVFTLGGLKIPAVEMFEDALQYTAVKIFINSARRVYPGYELRPEELSYLIRICRQCQGMPLAIELAASWVEALSLQEIAIEIAHNLDFLETTLRDVPERHRGVRATFDHSWRLLKEEERSNFVKFAVFRGSFSRKAAQAVTGLGLQQLTMLVNKSLLQRNADSGRYKVHELLRLYAEEELEARGETQIIRHTHGKYYLQAIHDLEEDLDGKDQLGALKSIESDIENVRSAAFCAADSGFYTQLASALYNLWRFYLIRRQFSLGETFFAQLAKCLKNQPESLERDLVLGEALANQSFYSSEHRNIQKAETTLQESESLLKDVSDPRLQVLLAYAKARYYIPSGRAREARPLLEKAISLCRQLNNRYLEAQGLHRLSNSYWIQIHGRDMAMATKYMEEAYSIRQDINDTLGIAWSLSSLGSYAMTQERYDEGERLTLEGLSLYRQIGHLEAAPHNLGVFAMRRGQWDKARRYMEESLAIANEQGDLNIVSWRSWILGNIEFHTGDFAHAQTLYSDGEALGKEIANNMWLVNCWNGLGNVAIAMGDYELAQGLFYRGLEIWLAENNRSFIPISRRYLGQVARLRGDYKEAHQHFDQTLAIFSELEDEGGRINTQRERAWLYFDQGKMTEARATAREVLHILADDRSAEDVLNPLVLMITSIECRTLLGAIACRERDFDRALYHYQRVLEEAGQNYSVPYMARFVGSSADYFRDQGNHRRAAEIAAFVAHYEKAFAHDRRHASTLLSDLKGRLNADGYHAAVERGNSMDLQTVIKALRKEFGVGPENSHDLPVA